MEGGEGTSTARNMLDSPFFRVNHFFRTHFAGHWDRGGRRSRAHGAYWASWRGRGSRRRASEARVRGGRRHGSCRAAAAGDGRRDGGGDHAIRLPLGAAARSDFTGGVAVVAIDHLELFAGRHGRRGRGHWPSRAVAAGDGRGDGRKGGWEVGRGLGGRFRRDLRRGDSLCATRTFTAGRGSGHRSGHRNGARNGPGCRSRHRGGARNGPGCRNGARYLVILRHLEKRRLYERRRWLQTEPSTCPEAQLAVAKMTTMRDAQAMLTRCCL